ncbi:MAG TPA: hypothetical protein PKD00_07305, partial [Burkholderiales bacterium]|nr:hypothetical protein [Burkholderiales bacterium]
MSHQINAEITNSNGYTLEWHVIQADLNCGYTVGEIITPTNGTLITSDPFTSTIEVDVESTCENIVFNIKVFNLECALCEEVFVNIDGSVETDFHFECTGEEPGCQFAPGTFDEDNPDHYATNSDCLECTDCACVIIGNPCDSIAFTAVYSCSPELNDNNYISLCLTENESNVPIQIESAYIGAPVNQMLYNVNEPNTDPIVLTISNPCSQILVPPTLMPAGYYYITLYVQVASCPMFPITLTVPNCPGTYPTVGQGGCCIESTPYDSQLDVPSLIFTKIINLDFLDGDYSQDIIIDFDNFNVADKMEVYNGVPDYNSLYYPLTPALEATLIASTPYVGRIPNIAANLPPCFRPSRIGDTDVVVEGFWQGNNTLGIYDATTNPGTTTGDSLSQANSTIPVLVPAFTYPGDGNAKGRLTVKGGTYTNPITIAYHGNGSPEGMIVDGVNCYSNKTVWRYTVICPDCPTFCGMYLEDLEYSCTPTPTVSFSMLLNGYEIVSPITVTIVPSSGQEIDANFSLYQTKFAKVEIFAPSTPATYYYPISLISIGAPNDALQFTITDNIGLELEDSAITFFYDDDSGADVPFEITGGTWYIEVEDATGCKIGDVVEVDCDACVAELTSTYDDTYCQGDAVNIVIEGTGFPCNLYSNHTLTGDALPVGLTITSPAANQLAIEGTVDALSGDTTYSVNLEVECGDCIADIDIEFTTHNPDCNFSAVITPEACLGVDGEIAVTFDNCDALLPIDWTLTGGASGTVVAFPTVVSETALQAGTYIMTFEDDNGCTWQQEFIVPTIGGPDVTPIKDIEIDCSVNFIDEIDVTISGGTGPYTVTIEQPLGTDISAGGVAGAGPTITVTNADITGDFTPGTYYVKVVDDNDCIGTTSFTITQTAPPDFMLTPGFEYCDSGDGIIGIFGITNVDPGNDVVYYGVGIDCNNLGTNIATPPAIPGLTADTYTVCVYDSGTECCTCKDVEVTNIGEALDPPVVVDYDICEGESVNMTATCASGTVRWINGNNIVVHTGSPYTISPLIDTTFTVDCYNTITGCQSTSEEVTVTINSPEEVNNLSSFICPNSNAPVVFADVLTDCDGDIVWYFAGTPILTTNTFSWGTATRTGVGLQLTNITSNVSFYYECTSIDGCVSTGNASVLLKSLPVVVTQPVTACRGTTINLGAALVSINGLAPIPPGYTVAYYSGLFSNCSSPTCTGSTISATQVVTAGLKTYKVKVTGPNGCSTCKCFTVIGAANPVVNVTANNPCEGGTLVLTGSPVITGANYSWTKNGSTLEGYTTSSISFSNATIAHNGIYQFTVTTGSGCIGSGSVVVSILPQQTISVTNSSACVNSGNHSLTIGGINNNLYTWEYVSGPANIMNGVQGTAYPSLSYNSVGLAGTYVYNICSTGQCPACDEVTITLSKTSVPKLKVVCYPDTFTNLFTVAPLAGHTYYWSSSALATCSSGTWTQIVNFAATVPNISTIYIKIVNNTTGCCAIGSTTIVNALPTMSYHDQGYTCNGNTGPTANTGNLLLEINPVSLPFAYNLNISGVNLTDGTTVTLPQFAISAGNNTMIPYTVSFLTSGTWVFTGYITVALTGKTLTTCPFELEIDIKCCPACSQDPNADPETSPPFLLANRILSLTERNEIGEVTP